MACVLDGSIGGSDQTGGNERPPTTLGKAPAVSPAGISFFFLTKFIYYFIFYMCKLDMNTCYLWRVIWLSSCQVLAGAEIGGLEGSHLVALSVCFFQGQVNLGSVSDNNDTDGSIDHYQ
jgi:hypothetical protein